MHAFGEFPSVLNLTNRQQFFHGLYVIDRKNVAKVFKTQVKPGAEAENFHFKVLNILT